MRLQPGEMDQGVTLPAPTSAPSALR